MASNKAEYEKLKAVWYKKLKKEGFEDIEADENTLKSYATGKFSIDKITTQNGGLEAKLEYYRLADRLTNEYEFSTDLDRCIWGHHASGMSLSAITKIVNFRKKKKNRLSVTMVFLRVKKLQEIMKDLYLAKYTNENKD